MRFNSYSFLDLLSNIVDNREKTCPTSEVGIPLIATNCIKNDSLYPVFEKVRYVTQETYDTWFRGHPESGDLLFVTKGSPGRVCWVDDPKKYCIAQDMLAVRANEEIIYPKYLFALLRSEKVQHQIGNMHVGTLIPHFKKGDFDKLYLEVPDNFEYQKMVGDLYFNLALSSHQRAMVNLSFESIARTIFKSWFVDFGPVRAKVAAIENADDPQRAAMQAISGKSAAELQSLSTENYQKLAATADLFPSELVETEHEKIPRGWEYQKLEEVTSFLSRGLTPKYAEEGVMVINQRCIRNHTIDFTQARFHNEELRSVGTKEVQVDDVLINSTGVGTLGRLAIVKRLVAKTTTDTHVTIVRADRTKICPEYLGYYLLNKESLIEELGEGSTGQTELKRVVLNEMLVGIPSMELQTHFASLVTPVLASISSNEEESIVLSNIRDTLLPKLLSGELQLT